MQQSKKSARKSTELVNELTSSFSSGNRKRIRDKDDLDDLNEEESDEESDEEQILKRKKEADSEDSDEESAKKSRLKPIDVELESTTSSLFVNVGDTNSARVLLTDDEEEEGDVVDLGSQIKAAKPPSPVLKAKEEEEEIVSQPLKNSVEAVEADRERTRKRGEDFLSAFDDDN